MDAVYEVLSFARSRKGGLRPEVPLQYGCEGDAERAARRAADRMALVIVARADSDSRSVLAAYGEAAEALGDFDI